jgi:hypothetical protein
MGTLRLTPAQWTAIQALANVATVKRVSGLRPHTSSSRPDHRNDGST